jgi:hypothetical protein
MKRMTGIFDMKIVKSLLKQLDLNYIITVTIQILLYYDGQKSKQRLKGKLKSSLLFHYFSPSSEKETI